MQRPSSSNSAAAARTCAADAKRSPGLPLTCMSSLTCSSAAATEKAYISRTQSNAFLASSSPSIWGIDARGRGTCVCMCVWCLLLGYSSLQAHPLPVQQRRRQPCAGAAVRSAAHYLPASTGGRRREQGFKGAEPAHLRGDGLPAGRDTHPLVHAHERGRAAGGRNVGERALACRVQLAHHCLRSARRRERAKVKQSQPESTRRGQVSWQGRASPPCAACASRPAPVRCTQQQKKAR